MIRYTRSENINPYTGKRFGLCRFDSDRPDTFWEVRASGRIEYPDDPAIRFAEPLIPTCWYSTAETYEAEGRAVLFAGIKKLLIRWLFLKWDKTLIERDKLQ